MQLKQKLQPEKSFDDEKVDIWRECLWCDELKLFIWEFCGKAVRSPACLLWREFQYKFSSWMLHVHVIRWFLCDKVERQLYLIMGTIASLKRKTRLNFDWNRKELLRTMDVSIQPCKKISEAYQKIMYGADSA